MNIMRSIKSARIRRLKLRQSASESKYIELLDISNRPGEISLDVINMRVALAGEMALTTAKIKLLEAELETRLDEVIAEGEDEKKLADDAKRLEWLLSGNGFFLEENGLCGHGPCDEDEKNNARAAIDEAMAEREVEGEQT